jgi:hypothetical protein
MLALTLCLSANCCMYIFSLTLDSKILSFYLQDPQPKPKLLVNIFKVHVLTDLVIQNAARASDVCLTLSLLIL